MKHTYWLPAVLLEVVKKTDGVREPCGDHFCVVVLPLQANNQCKTKLDIYRRIILMVRSHFLLISQHSHQAKNEISPSAHTLTTFLMLLIALVRRLRTFSSSFMWSVCRMHMNRMYAGRSGCFGFCIIPGFRSARTDISRILSEFLNVVN